MHALRAAAFLALASGLAACSSDPEPPVLLAWCYQTLGDAECYLEPDGMRPASFIGTYPLTIPGTIGPYGISNFPAPTVTLAIP